MKSLRIRLKNFHNEINIFIIKIMPLYEINMHIICGHFLPFPYKSIQVGNLSEMAHIIKQLYLMFSPAGLA